MSKRQDHAETVAKIIIQQLEKGTSKFQRPWRDSLNSDSPRNGVTGKKYKGINAIYLDAVRTEQGKKSPLWFTFNAIQKLPVAEDGKRPLLRKGTKGVLVEKWTFEKEEKGPDGKPIKVKLERPFVQYWPVFNGDDIIGLKPYVATDKNPEWADVNRCEALLQDVFAEYREVYKEKGVALDEGHQFLRHGGRHTDEAFYAPHLDYIQMPEKQQFDNPVKYYTVAFHELGHSTGHPHRLDRDLSGRFGSEQYAKEELRAEIASMLLGDALGIGHDGERHAAYVKSWIKVLKDDPQEIFRAAREAENIASFVLKREKNKPLETDASSSLASEVTKPERITQTSSTTKAPSLRYRIDGLEQEFDDLPSAMKGFINDRDVIMQGHNLLLLDDEKTYHLIGHDWVNDGSDHRYEYATDALKAYHLSMVRRNVPEAEKSDALDKAIASLPGFIEQDEQRQARAIALAEKWARPEAPAPAMAEHHIEKPQSNPGPWKHPSDLVEGDVVIERNENGKAIASTVDDVRFVRDAMVHVDFDNGARTSIFPAERKLRVATLEEQGVMVREGIEAAFPNEAQVQHLPEVEKLTMDWVMRVMDKAGPTVSFDDLGLSRRDDGRFTKFMYGSTHLAYLDKGEVSRKALSDALYMNIYSPNEDGKDHFVWASEKADKAVELETSAQFDAFKVADARFEAELHRVYGNDAGDARYFMQHDDADVQSARQAFYKASNDWHEAVLDARQRVFNSLRPNDWEAQVERHAGALNWLAEKAEDSNPGYNPMESFRVLQEQAQKEGLRTVALLLPAELNGAFECARVEYYKPDGERVPVYTDIGPDGKCLSHVGAKRVPATRFSSDDETIGHDLRVALSIVAGDSVLAQQAKEDLRVQEGFERRMAGLPAGWNGEIALEPAVFDRDKVRPAKDGENPNLYGVYAFDGNQKRVWLSDVNTTAEAEKFVGFLRERRPFAEPKLVAWSEVMERERLKAPVMHMHARRDEDLRSYPVLEEMILKYESDRDRVSHLRDFVTEYSKPLLIEHMQVQRGTHDSVVHPELGEGNALNQIRLFSERQPDLAKAIASNWGNQMQELGREQQVLANAIMKTPGGTNSPWDEASFVMRVHAQAQQLHWEADNEHRRRSIPIVPEVMSTEWAYRAEHAKSRTHSWTSGTAKVTAEQKEQLKKDIEDCRLALDAASQFLKTGDWDKGLHELGKASSYECLVHNDRPAASKQFFMQDLYEDVQGKWQKWRHQNGVGEHITPRMKRDFEGIPKDLSKLAPGMQDELRAPGMQKVLEQVGAVQSKTKAKRAGRSA